MTTKAKLRVEVNAKGTAEPVPSSIGGVTVMVTPPIDDEWRQLKR